LKETLPFSEMLRAAIPLMWFGGGIFEDAMMLEKKSGVQRDGRGEGVWSIADRGRGGFILIFTVGIGL
jgi:hypothetical protein